MTIFLITLFAISFVAMAIMVSFKMAEIQTGRRYLFFSDKTDQLVIDSQESISRFFKRWNLRTFVLIYHFILEKLENFFIRIYRRIRNKLTKPVEMVKGKGDLPENTSSSSFYLKNIEEHKEKNRE